MMKTTPWKEYRADGSKFRIRATYGIDYDFAKRNRQAPYFSITGEIEERRGNRWMDFSGGTIHSDIARRFPKLRPYLKWHLVSTEQPMHYLANAKYWWEKVIGISEWPAGPGEPDPMDAFLSTIVFGGLGDEAPPSQEVQWPEVKEWLDYRLPLLQERFQAEMEELEVL